MKNLLIAFFFCVFAVAAHAHSFHTGSIEIGHPWAMPTKADAQTSEVYLAFMNMGDKADQLMGASTSVAHKAVLNDGHGDVPTIELPVKRGVALRPGAAHVKLVGLKGGLSTGDKFTLRLTLANAPPLDVTVYVEDHAAH